MLSTTCAATGAPTTCRRETSSTPRANGRAPRARHVLPVGSECIPVSELGDGSGLRVVQKVNGEVLQDGNTTDLIFTVPFLIAYISAAFTLEPGDLILTGTPPGVGWARDPKRPLRPGDVVEVEVDGIGVLRNPVIAES